jgi:hypothetical protein
LISSGLQLKNGSHNRTDAISGHEMTQINHLLNTKAALQGVHGKLVPPGALKNMMQGPKLALKISRKSEGVILSLIYVLTPSTPAKSRSISL